MRINKIKIESVYQTIETGLSIPSAIVAIIVLDYEIDGTSREILESIELRSLDTQTIHEAIKRKIRQYEHNHTIMMKILPIVQEMEGKEY